METRDGLRRDFSRLKEVTPFSKAPKLAGMIASLGIHREIGTVNDELARFIFAINTGEVISRDSLKAEIVAWRTFTGVRIWSEESSRLEMRAKWFHDMLHPSFSYNADGSIKQLVIFPEIISRITALQGVELVLVKSWGMNSIFGGFDPSKEYYQTNFWELENNDSALFSDLVRQNKLALLGTHDLIAHVTGVKSERWKLLNTQAQMVFDSINLYFEDTTTPTIASLIVPYTIGVILDDLAQPPTYGSASHALFLELLVSVLRKKTVPANLPTVLTQFPNEFKNIIELSRLPGIVKNPERAKILVDQLVAEILEHSLVKVS